MIRSLRMQILLGMAVSILLMFVCSTVALHFVLRHHIYQQYFDDLQDRARTLAMYTEYENGQLRFEWAHYDSHQAMKLDPKDGTGCIFKIWRAHDEVLAEVNAFEELKLDPEYDTSENAGYQPTFKPVILPDGTTAYQVTFRFEAVLEDEHAIEGPLPQLGITTIRRTVSVDQTMFRTDMTLVGATTATMILSIAGMLILIHNGLKPLEPVLKQLKTIGAGELSQRIEPGNLPHELVAIIHTVNDLLAELEIKLERERRFVANAAHELRNPITAVRANLEVALLNTEHPELNEENLRSSLEAARHLQIVCERLLSLAGLHQDNISRELQEVEVMDLIDTLMGDIQEDPAYKDKAIVFNWKVCDKAAIETDPVLLNVILSNLLRNAAAYGNREFPIEMNYEVDEKNASISISNRTAGQHELDVAKMMEPFWRGETQRSLGEGHLGLGLTIAKSAAEQLKGTLSCELQDENRQFVATLTLPRRWNMNSGINAN